MERGEELFGNEWIAIEEIQMISGGDYETAEREHQIVRDSLAYDSEELLVSDYCNYYNLDLDDIIEFLNGLRYEPEWKMNVEDIAFDLELEETQQIPEALIDFPFELFDKNAEPNLDDFEDFFNINEEGGNVDGCSTNNQ